MADEPKLPRRWGACVCPCHDAPAYVFKFWHQVPCCAPPVLPDPELPEKLECELCGGETYHRITFCGESSPICGDCQTPLGQHDWPAVYVRIGIGMERKALV